MTVFGWILILAFSTGTAVVPVAYPTEAACDAAAHKATDDHPGPVAYFCVPVDKGTADT